MFLCYFLSFCLYNIFFLHFSRFLSKKETERNGSKETKRKSPFFSREKWRKEGLSDIWGTSVIQRKIEVMGSEKHCLSTLWVRNAIKFCWLADTRHIWFKGRFAHAHRQRFNKKLLSLKHKRAVCEHVKYRRCLVCSHSHRTSLVVEVTLKPSLASFSGRKGRLFFCPLWLLSVAFFS